VVSEIGREGGPFGTSVSLTRPATVERMRVLLTTWGWASHFFPLVQLGWALQSAGHEVRVASQPGLAGAIHNAGLTAVPVGTAADYTDSFTDFQSHLARWPRPVDMSELLDKFGAGTLSLYVDIAEDMLPGLHEYAVAWRPDLVIHEPTTYAGPIVARSLGVPSVRHIWGMDFTYLSHEYEPVALRKLTDRFGLSEMDSLGDVTIDPCPPSLRGDERVPRLSMRYVPYNGPSVVPRWLWEPPARPRVCVTGGTVGGRFEGAAKPFEVRVLDALAGLDAEVVVVNPIGELEARSGVRVIDRIAMHLLLPTCALVVHSGGGGTILTAINSGTPQVLVPRMPDHVFNARRLEAAGASRTCFAATETAELLRECVTDVLTAPGHRTRTEELRAEMAAAPSAFTVVDQLAELVKSLEVTSVG
jgi:UDP:flavonoid glycosyltransferase YjiC (YdhE family)